MSTPSLSASVRRSRWAARGAAALLGVSAAVAPLAAPAALAAPVERITNFDIRLDLRSDGSLAVTETIRYDFGDQARHGILRTIPVRFHLDATHDRITPLSAVTATADGASVRFDTHVDGGVQYIRIGDPDRTVTGAHTYVIRYTARGVTNAVDGRTELDWNAVGDRWTVPIMAATVAVTAPAPVTRTACAAGAPGGRAACQWSTVGGRVATFRQEGLRAGTGLTVVVAVPAGSVAAAPMVVRRHDPAAAWRVTPAAAAGGLGIAAAGMLAVLLALRSARRRPPAGPQVEPPDGIRPGEAGTLVDGRADTVDVTATIVDLAVRGHLRIRQLPRAEPEDWELARLDGARGDLAWYEQTLMRALFDGRQRVRLSELGGGSAEDLARVRRQLDERMVSRGWYRQSPERTRRRIRGIGVALLAAALGATVALGLLVQAAPLGAGAALACLLLLVLAGRLVAPTGPGRVMLARVEAFRRHLLVSEPAGAELSRYLPYAMVFGMADHWAHRLADLESGDDPGVVAGAGGPSAYWYTGAGTGFHRSFQGFSAATAATVGAVATTPTAAGGATGFTSGTGTSGTSAGGGFGGGGGGSW